MAALLVDGYRRTINYLRVSVTNACDFHCVYCDPQGDSCVLPLESLVRLVKVAALCGITHAKVIYPVGVIKSSRHPEASKAFEAYLFSDEAKNVFKKYGFTVI